MTEQQRLLELALIGLHSERARIEKEIMELSRRLGNTPTAFKHYSARNLKGGGDRPKRVMSTAQKKKISAAMKARWASRRRGNAHK